MFSIAMSATMTGCDDDPDLICMDKVWYEDKDGDGKGNFDHYVYSCKVQPEGFVSNADDLDDTDPNG